MSTGKKKKTSWSYEASVATVKFPDGVTANFETASIISGDVHQFLFHYGVKQFLSDKIAGIGKGATSADKLEVFNDYFELLVSGETKKAITKGKMITKADFIAEAPHKYGGVVPRH